MDKELVITDENRDFYIKLGKTITKTRKEREISLEKLAEVANITPNQLAEYESGTFAIPVYTLIPILQFMNYPGEFDNLV